MPKVSIITTSYNYEKYIAQTIESIINQTYSDWELIIADDGSSDRSVEIIEKYCNQDSRIKLYTHNNNQNKGLAETLKLALEKVKGEYVAFLESDDYWEKSYLETKINAFNKYPDVQFIYNSLNIISESNSEQKAKIWNKSVSDIEQYWDRKKNPHYINNIICFKNIILSFSCVMLKTDLLKSCLFDCPKPAWIDWWLWIQCANKTKIFFLYEKLTNYRAHSASFISNEYSKKVQNLKTKEAFFNGFYKFANPTTINAKFKFLCIKTCRAIKYRLQERFR